jgi:hypothetical protein
LTEGRRSPVFETELLDPTTFRAYGVTTQDQQRLGQMPHPRTLFSEKTNVEKQKKRMNLYDGPEAADFWRYRKAKIQDRHGKTGDVEIKKLTYFLPWNFHKLMPMSSASSSARS